MATGNASRKEVDEEEEDAQVLLAMSGVFSRLVPDIFLDIMSRLPLKSLSQCRWVCKSWYNFIKTPTLAKIQYEWAINNNSPYLFCFTYFFDVFLVDDQVFHNHETSTTAHSLKLNQVEEVHTHLAGYANGLICLSSDPVCYVPSSIYIFNPITGEHIVIPKSPKYKYTAIPAFGFDPITNEYKVLRFIVEKDEDEEYFTTEGEVYTLGSSGWRKMENVPHIMDTDRCGLLLNGNLHWIPDFNKFPIINTFNVGSEKFDVLQPHPHLLQMDYRCSRLVLIEGHLGFLQNEFGEPYEIWVMEDYGVQSSWVKRYSFFSKENKSFWSRSINLIKLKNGEILLKFADEDDFMGYFDPEKDTLRPIRIMKHNEKHELDYYFQTVMQVGSLFSPKDVAKSRRKKEEGRSGTEDEHDESGSDIVSREDEDEDNVEDLQEPTEAKLMTIMMVI